MNSSLKRKSGSYRVDPEYGYTPFGGREFAEIDAPRADIITALAIVEEAFTTTPEKILLAELGTLRLKTISRGNSDVDVKLQMRAYTKELASYPADIVISVIRKHARTEKWWPALSELLAPIKAEMADRIALREALLQARDG